MSAPVSEGHWKGRPLLAALVRVFAIGVPVLAGWLVARLMASVTAGWATAWLRVGVVLVAALAVSMIVSRVTSRVLPLAVLLRMTMLFPDRAPSRLMVARRTTSLADIKARLGSPRLDEQEAAATMLALVTALGHHDRHTRGHSERVRLFCDLLAKELGLSAADAGRLRWAGLIHDIGKLEIPASVLNKPAELHAREWDMIRCHPYAGARLAAPLREWLGPWFAGIPEHHEKYDGTGYPSGLAAGEISIAGRAIALVDAFETMTAARSYKSARSTLSAREELTRCAGTHFDPVMVRAFLAISLPRLLWSVGPLAFAVNLPYLQAAGQSGVRLGNVVTTASTSAVNVAGATAVAVAVSTAPAVASSAAPADHATTHKASQPHGHDAKAKAKPAKPGTPGKPSKPGKPGQAAGRPGDSSHSGMGDHAVDGRAPGGAPGAGAHGPGADPSSPTTHSHTWSRHHHHRGGSSTKSGNGSSSNGSSSNSSSSSGPGGGKY